MNSFCRQVCVGWWLLVRLLLSTLVCKPPLASAVISHNLLFYATALKRHSTVIFRVNYCLEYWYCHAKRPRSGREDESDFSEIHPNKKHAECSFFSSISIGFEPPCRLNFLLSRVICQTPSGLQLLLAMP